MRIIEGELPQESKRWRVLIPHTIDFNFGKSWQLALLLAESGVGQVLLAVTVPSETEQNLIKAREFSERAKKCQRPKVKIFPFIVTTGDYQREVNNFIREQDVDVLVDDISDPIVHNLNRCPCAVAAVRGDIRDEENGEQQIKRIAVPTSGGPNTIYALSMLMHAAPEVEIDALYFAAEERGEHERALGRSRLRQVLEYIDGQEVIHSQVITTPSIIDGIREAAKEYDLVVIGATRESSIDKVLFGNIPDAVVRDSKTTMVIMREPKNPVAHVLGLLSFRLQQFLPRLTLAARTDTYVRIRQAARPNIDYYILISLAALIAGLGLVANSAAVVIGAMLVAPLMSPIVGTGLATVLGDTRFLRLSFGAVLRGALLAIFLGMIVGLFQIGQPLNSELLARTQPSLLDLAIALFSGMAAAFALSRSNAAGALPGVAIAAALVPPLATVGIAFTAGYYVESFGALLLFVTNFVSIGTATALVFIILGFRPAASQKARQQARLRSAQVAMLLLIVVVALLVGTSYWLGRQQAQESRIHEVVAEQLAEVAGADLQNLNIIEFNDGNLTIDVIARSQNAIGYQMVKDLQEAIGAQLVADGIIDEISMTMTVIRVTDLDPLIPPTPTPGPSPTPVPEVSEENS